MIYLLNSVHPHLARAVLATRCVFRTQRMLATRSILGAQRHVFTPLCVMRPDALAPLPRSAAFGSSSSTTTVGLAPAAPTRLVARTHSSSSTVNRQVAVFAAATDGGVDVGQVVGGVVSSIAPFGAFVELQDGHGRGLLHISQISCDRVGAVEDVFQVGDEVKVMILTQGDGRISLSTKQLESEAGDMLRDPAAVYDNAEEAAAAWRARRGSNPRGERGGERGGGQRGAERGRELRKGEVVTGVVSALRAFGAFVDISGGGRGLLHISQISGERIVSPSDVLQVGDTITALVVRVDNENGRISLSTRKLEANSGDMLRDPQRVYDNAEVAAAEWRERGPPPMFGHQEDDM